MGHTHNRNFPIVCIRLTYVHLITSSETTLFCILKKIGLYFKISYKWHTAIWVIFIGAAIFVHVANKMLTSQAAE